MTYHKEVAGTATPAVAADLEEAQRFLDTLDPNTTSWTFQTFDDNADRKAKDLARVYHGTLDQHAGNLSDLQARGAGIFVTVNETDGQGRSKANITRARAAYVDLDGSPLGPVTAWETPHIVVDSSPGRWHAYWLIDGLDLDQFTPTQKALIEAFNADESVHDLPRVMRLPGFHHQKVDSRRGLIGTPFMVRMQDTGAFPAAFTAKQFLEKVAALKPAETFDFDAPLSVRAAPPAPNGLTIDTGHQRKTPDDIAALIRGMSIDGDKHKAVRGFAASMAARGTDETTVRALVSVHCPVSDSNVDSLITSAFQKFRKGQTDTPKFRHVDLSLVRDTKERPYWNTNNAIEILQHHPEWAGVLGFNEFTRRREVLKPIPGIESGAGRNLEDEDTTAVLSWFNRNGFPMATATVAVAAVHAVARRNSFDPLKDYMQSLSWDGTKRIDEWLTIYCGAEASDYTREAGRRWLISAVARALKPGCKADHMLVLEGEQGARKSSALSALAGEEWFCDALPPMNTKDASSFLRGKWIVEVAELEAMRREMDAVKAFISRQSENYRPAYGREEVDEPRRCIFAGTTNKDTWLRDETGGRRFWPVQVGEIDLDGIKRDRHQLWAEAVAAYNAGERWWMEGEVEDEARKEQASRMAIDPWQEIVAEATSGVSEITIREILTLIGLSSADHSRKESDRIAALLKRQGWQRDGRVTAGEYKGQSKYRPRE